MFTTITILNLLFLVFYKKNIRFYIVVFSSAYLMFSVVIDGHVNGFWQSLYVKNDIYIDLEVIMAWSLVFFFYNLSVLSMRSKDINIWQISNWKNSYVGYWFFLGVAFFIISGGVVLYRVIELGGIDLMFSSPRTWEHKFGANVFLNYLYFLHLPAILILTVTFSINYKRKTSFVLVVLLIFVTLFHGIKFTVIHGFSFFLFTYYYVGKEKVGLLLVSTFSLLILLLVLYFQFVRGGGFDGVVGYVVSPAINSIYYMNNFDWVDVGSPFNNFPLNTGLIEKIKYRLNGGFAPLLSLEERGFVLNDLYNLESAITKLGLISGAGYGMSLFFISRVIDNIRSTAHLNMIGLYLIIFFIESVSLSFTAWELSKLKLWYCFGVIFLFEIVYKLLRSMKRG